MGDIGPRQQRFEVLPERAWQLADLIDEWRTTPAPDDRPHSTVLVEPVEDVTDRVR